MKALLAAVLILSAWILFRPGHEFQLSRASPEAAKLIRLERTGMPEIRIERKGNEWEIVSPVRAKAGSNAVGNLLSILHAKSDTRLEAKDLSRFGLERPVIRLFIDTAEYDFGMVNPVTGQQYVKEGESVFMVSTKYALQPSLSELEAGHA